MINGSVENTVPKHSSPDSAQQSVVLSAAEGPACRATPAAPGQTRPYSTDDTAPRAAASATTHATAQTAAAPHTRTPSTLAERDTASAKSRAAQAIQPSCKREREDQPPSYASPTKQRPERPASPPAAGSSGRSARPPAPAPRTQASGRSCADAESRPPAPAAAADAAGPPPAAVA
jgi:hypothetical protein